MQRFYILLSLALVSLVLALVTIDRETKEVLSKQNTKLLPELIEQLDTVNAISIETGKGIRFKAQRINGQWLTSHLSEQFYFPANPNAVDNLLNSLATARIYAVKTNREEKFAKLNLASITAPDSGSVLVRLYADSKEWSLLVGKTSEHRDASFVRDMNSTQSYLLDRSITLPQSQIAWLTSQVMQLSTEGIDTIEVREQRTVSFTPEQAQQWSEDFYQALINTEYVNVLEKDNVLLSWFTRNPIRKIAIENQQNRFDLSLFKNSESEQVWLVVKSEKDSWQQDWTFELTPTAAKHLLTPVN